MIVYDDDTFVMTNHVAAEDGEGHKNGGGEGGLAEFLTSIENCISPDQLCHTCLIIEIMMVRGMIMIG